MISEKGSKSRIYTPVFLFVFVSCFIATRDSSILSAPLAKCEEHDSRENKCKKEKCIAKPSVDKCLWDNTTKKCTKNPDCKNDSPPESRPAKPESRPAPKPKKPGEDPPLLSDLVETLSDEEDSVILLGN